MRRTERPTLRALRLALGLLTLAAVGFQFATSLKTPNYNPVNFFSFYTIISNTFAAFVLLFVAGARKTATRGVDLLRGAAVFCLAIVGIVFSALLANVESGTVPWVNLVVHYITPVAAVLDWVVDPPHSNLRITDGLLWLLVPLVYICYTLVRGSLVHWYPYPFLDVGKNGYASVTVYIAAIFVLSLLVALVVLAAGNRLGARPTIA